MFSTKYFHFLTIKLNEWLYKVFKTSFAILFIYLFTNSVFSNIPNKHISCYAVEIFDCRVDGEQKALFSLQDKRWFKIIFLSHGYYRYSIKDISTQNISEVIHFSVNIILKANNNKFQITKNIIKCYEFFIKSYLNTILSLIYDKINDKRSKFP